MSAIASASTPGSAVASGAATATDMGGADSCSKKCCPAMENLWTRVCDLANVVGIRLLGRCARCLEPQVKHLAVQTKPCISRFQNCRYHVESRLGAIAERIIGVRHVRSDQGTKDLENHIVRCVLRRAYLAAASTRGSELGCLVLGDFNHALSDVRDVMQCIPG